MTFYHDFNYKKQVFGTTKSSYILIKFQTWCNIIRTSQFSMVHTHRSWTWWFETCRASL